MDINEILSRYPEEKPLALNYATVREDIQALAADNGLLFDEVLNLAREGIEREKRLAKLEAEAQHWAQAEADGQLAPPCKIGDKVWAIRNYKGVCHVQDGIVSEMLYTKDMKLHIVVKHIARGEIGKAVFLTRDEATAALEGAGDE